MFDLFILLALVWALYSGWQNGVIRELTSSLGIFVGLFFALMFYAALGKYLTVDGSEVNMMTSVFAFILLWVAVPFALGLAANMLTRFFKSIALSPLICLLGALLSLLKFSVLIGCILVAMREMRILNEAQVRQSRCYPALSWVARNTVRLFTQEIKQQKTSPHRSTQQGDTIWVKRK